MGARDRTIRVGIAIAIAVLYFTHLIDGIIALVLLGIMGVLFVTSFYRYCPVYHSLKMDTLDEDKPEQE